MSKSQFAPSNRVTLAEPLHGKRFDRLALAPTAAALESYDRIRPAPIVGSIKERILVLVRLPDLNTAKALHS